MTTSTQTPSDDMGEFFLPPRTFALPSLDQLKSIKFYCKRTDLQVYHLAYGTKKLKACTYRRMMKRQNRLNQARAKKLIVRSPQDRMEKAAKQTWLRDIEITVKENQLISCHPAGMMKQKKRKRFTKLVRQRLAQAASTQMKD